MVWGLTVISLLLNAQVGAAATQWVDNPAFSGVGYQGDPAVCVAVIDTGIDYLHPKIAPYVFNDRKSGARGWDFADGDAFPFDFEKPHRVSVALSKLTGIPVGQVLTDFDYIELEEELGFMAYLLPEYQSGHGTHVAGIALEASGTGCVLPLRVDYRATNFLDQVRQAVEFAAAAGVRVVNMSFGWKKEDVQGQAAEQSLARLQQAMKDHGELLFVIAAGNEGQDLSTEDGKGIWPKGLSIENKLVVGAIDNQGELASFSNYPGGDGGVDIFAPGVNIKSTWPGGSMFSASGTSMAAPAVAGQAARLLMVDPTLSTSELKRRVFESCSLHALVHGKRGSAEAKPFSACLLDFDFDS